MEFLDSIGGLGIDAEISKNFQRILTKQGVKFKLSTKVLGASREGSTIKVAVEGVKNAKVSSSHCFGKEHYGYDLCCVMDEKPIIVNA